jgi:3-oxoacyl-[acyl-carrier protein] reductase
MPVGRHEERSVVDVGQMAAFVASDRARTLTSTQVNISCGAHGD